MYDVSQFIARHPGGVDQLMLGAGRDVTQLFESYHSFDTYKLAEHLYSILAYYIVPQSKQNREWTIECQFLSFYTLMLF